MNINSIPAELRDTPQWVNWRTLTRGGKPTKPPFQPNGNPADSTRPDTWTDFETAFGADNRHIGFVLTQEAGITGIDLDYQPMAQKRLAKVQPELCME